MPDGGYLWYDVTGITPARDRTLAEVKDKVETRWRDDEIAKRLQAKANDMVGKLKAGTALDQLATETGLKVVTATDLQRGKPGGFAPAKLVEAAFKIPKDVPSTAEGEPRDRALRVQGHRRRRSTARSRRQQGDRDLAAERHTPTTSSAPMSRGWKTISASSSTSRR